MDEQANNRLAEWISAAQLTPKEWDCLELWLQGISDNGELSRRLGCSRSTASVHKSAIRRKLAAALEETRASARLRDLESQDEAAIEGAHNFYAFLLAAMSGPHTPNPNSPLIGRTWKDASGATLCETGRVGAGSRAVVTVDDLTGKSGPVSSALDARLRARARHTRR